VRDSGKAVMWSGLAWALSYFAARGALAGEVFAGWARVAVALAPLPFFVAFLAAFIRNVRGMDELERRIQLEALGIAFPLALVLVMTLGLVQVARPLDPANWSYRHLWPFMAAFYAAGLAVARRRYL
jgi:hypothetical protein